MAAPLGSYANPLKEAPINVAPSARELWAAQLQDYAQANGLQAPPDNASMSELYQYYDRWQQASGQPNVSLVSIQEDGQQTSTPLSGVNGVPVGNEVITVDLGNPAPMIGVQATPAPLVNANSATATGTTTQGQAGTALGADSYLASVFAGYSESFDQLLSYAKVGESQILGITSDLPHNVGDIATPIFGAVGIMEMAHDIEAGNYRAAFVTGGQTAGGIVGAELGAYAGGLVALMPPPFDAAAPVFSVAGAIVGSNLGAEGGGYLANSLYNWIEQPPQQPQQLPPAQLQSSGSQ